MHYGIRSVRIKDDLFALKRTLVDVFLAYRSNSDTAGVDIPPVVGWLENVLILAMYQNLLPIHASRLDQIEIVLS
jgi:hypothetical protein